MAENKNGQSGLDAKTVITALIISLVAGGTGGFVGGSDPGQLFRGGAATVQTGNNGAGAVARALDQARQEDQAGMARIIAALEEIGDTERWRRERLPLLERVAELTARLDRQKSDIGGLDEKYLTLREFAEARKGLWSRVLQNERDVKRLEERERTYLYRGRK